MRAAAGAGLAITPLLLFLTPIAVQNDKYFTLKSTSPFSTVLLLFPVFVQSRKVVKVLTGGIDSFFNLDLDEYEG